MQNQENTKENEVLFVMKILTSTQFKELDKYTIGHEPVSSIDLMERAAKAIAAELKSRWTTATRFIVFAGPGNNGGIPPALQRRVYGTDVSVQHHGTSQRRLPEQQEKTGKPGRTDVHRSIFPILLP